MKINLCIGQSILHILSVYAPQIGCEEKEKNDFRAILDEAVMEIPKDDLVIIGGDLNAHVGKARDSYKRHHGGFGYDGRNDEGEHWYKENPDRLHAYLAQRLKDVIDCKVTPGKDIAAQHKLLVMDLHITNNSQNKIKLEQCIKCCRLKSMTDAFAINANIETKDSSQRWYKSKKPDDKTNYKKSKIIATKAVARAKAMAYDDITRSNQMPQAYEKNKARGPDDIPIESLKD
ncbi:uncharacterized protein LOC135926841 [Gordionus sp. m RMFG-2023]|uniref:uncharacterized protein LOC135926841 n=1 Tax=Gordionus sp. m RMFG-2023 TaxID=3053472 RepID=UPI0031FCFAD0